ncbi:unnamed protein product [Psylliodes chrysocephalus]|uniref:Uncharacterized protein n=1 Tax=Psylliodes chrysocephalus TaxID=3402493 RepID=A0A9P0D9E3_9CUCU|nr:unnamed protein product [Psylliodes chrysocephala]
MEENKEQKPPQHEPVEERKASKEDKEKTENPPAAVEKPAKTSYGRKKRKPKITIGVREPIRKTIYDILLENLKFSGRKTFIHRLIYAGIHTFPIEQNCKFDTATPITKFFRNIINKTNNSVYVLEKMTGFLVYYDMHFIHLVEGDEDALGIHLRLLYESEDFDKIEKLKLFAVVNHIHARMMTDWLFYYGTPRKCVATIDISTGEDLAMVLYICIQKVLKLIIQISSQMSQSDILVDPSSLRIRGSDTENVPRASRSSITVTASNIHNRNNPMKGLLPEVEQLDILLPSEWIPELVEYKNSYGRYVVRASYKDQVWPIPSDFIPYDIFDTGYRMVIEFPKSGTKKEHVARRKSEQPPEDDGKNRKQAELEEEEKEDEEEDDEEEDDDLDEKEFTK